MKTKFLFTAGYFANSFIKVIYVKYFVLLTIFFPSLLLSQSDSIKKITDFNLECRNASFLVSPINNIFFPKEIELFFESREDSFSNIYSLKYNAPTDSFYDLRQFSENGYINRNPAAQFFDIYNYNYYKIVLWETNQNGNWDIVCSVDSGNGYSEPQFLFNSPDDELDASFIFNPFIGSDYSHKIIFTRGNSVYLYTKNLYDNKEREELIFEGNDTIKYSNPVIALTFIYSSPILWAAAERRINEGEPYLVSRTTNNSDTDWVDIEEIYYDTPAINPEFFSPGYYSYALSFESITDTQKKVLWLDLDFWRIYELLENSFLETSNFSFLNLSSGAIEKILSGFQPLYSFKYVKDDSVFIREGVLNNIEWPPNGGYNDFYTKVYDAKPAIGSVGDNGMGIVTYTVWEDSSNGKINLFGKKRINITVDVEDKNPSSINFQLFQNYPNPFNPLTIITFSLVKEELVELKVYDVLGREITTLVNKTLKQGKHEVIWDASSFSSGVYYYIIKAGNKTQTRKMLLVK
jgi:hypothetical protein